MGKTCARCHLLSGSAFFVLLEDFVVFFKSFCDFSVKCDGIGTSFLYKPQARYVFAVLSSTVKSFTTHVCGNFTRTKALRVVAGGSLW
jgi:hypothetical protein